MSKETIMAFDEYLKSQQYEVNPTRYADLKNAYQIAKTLFADMSITIKDDALNLGGKCLCIQGFDINISGENEINLFSDLISKADNFEIISLQFEHIEFNIMFYNCLQKLK